MVRSILLYTPNEILNEFVLYNKDIKIRNKPIVKKFMNIPNLKIIDKVENNGFKTLIQFKRSMNSSITQMKYNSVISAIPPKWKKIIKGLTIESHSNFTTLNDDEPQLKINNIIKPLSKCNNKNIYLTLLCKYCKGFGLYINDNIIDINMNVLLVRNL